MQKLWLYVVMLSINIISQCADDTSDKEKALQNSLENRCPIYLPPLDLTSNELRNTFKAIQIIHRELSKDITTKPDGSSDRYPCFSLDPLYDPLHNQTEQGIYLSIGFLPLKLHTPWGRVNIQIMHTIPVTTFTLFRKHLKLAFVSNRAEKKKKNPTFDVEREYDFYKGNKHVDKEMLEQYRGSDKMITSKSASYLFPYPSLYAVLAVEGITLPEPKRRCKNMTVRNAKDVEKCWNSLMENYKQEEHQPILCDE